MDWLDDCDDGWRSLTVRLFFWIFCLLCLFLGCIIKKGLFISCALHPQRSPTREHFSRYSQVIYSYKKLARWILASAFQKCESIEKTNGLRAIQTNGKKDFFLGLITTTQLTVPSQHRRPSTLLTRPKKCIKTLEILGVPLNFQDPLSRPTGCYHL